LALPIASLLFEVRARAERLLRPSYRSLACSWAWRISTHCCTSKCTSLSCVCGNQQVSDTRRQWFSRNDLACPTAL